MEARVTVVRMILVMMTLHIPTPAPGQSTNGHI